jgi:hypothetical protein
VNTSSATSSRGAELNSLTVTELELDNQKMQDQLLLGQQEKLLLIVFL